MAARGRKLDDILAALDWCFSPEGDASIGVRLTAASAPLWFQLSLLDEYGGRLERALQALNADPTPNVALDMNLNAMLGAALMQSRGPTPGAAAAFSRALEIADLLGHIGTRWLALAGLGGVRLLSGDYPTAVDFSERALLDSVHCGDDAAVVSHRLSALTHHFAGNHATARRHAERVLERPDRTRPWLGSDWIATRAALSRILWVQGFPDQALRAALDSVEHGLTPIMPCPFAWR